MDVEKQANGESFAADYFIHKDDATYGPETEANLRLLHAQGWLLPNDLIWREGEPEWRAVAVAFALPFAMPVVSAPEDLEEENDFQLSAVQLGDDPPWLWGPIGIAVVIHVLLFVAILGWLRIYPVNFEPYTVPASTEPPLEVAMVTEPVSQPPPPDPPPDPPDSAPSPPPPPMPLPDLPPPPPAPAEMPIPSVPPPPLPSEPVELPHIATETPPMPIHHKAPKAVVRAAPVPQPPEDVPAPADSNHPEYLSDPRPEYPIAARQRHQQGTVVLLVTMDEAGNPTSVSVEQSSGFSVLDHAALRQVASLWKFKPGQGLTVHVPVEFHLDN
jgi:protein TonB